MIEMKSQSLVATFLLLIVSGSGVFAQSPQPQNSIGATPLLLPMPSLTDAQRSEIKKLQLQRFEVFQSLVKPNAQDDEIKKLQRQRLKAALLCVEIVRVRFESGVIPVTSLMEFQKLAAVAALELAETKEKKIQCMDYILQLVKDVEERALELRKSGRGSSEELPAAQYWRIQAEIDLLKLKQDLTSK